MNRRVPHSRQVTRGFRLSFQASGSPRTIFTASAGYTELGRIGAAVHGLAVVAMAEELHNGFGGDFDLDRAAAAFDLGHSFGSGSLVRRRLRQGSA